MDMVHHKIKGLDSQGRVILPKSTDEIRYYPIFLLRTKECYVCRSCEYDEMYFVVIADNISEAVKEFISDGPLCLLCLFKDMAEGDVGSYFWSAFRIIDLEDDECRRTIEGVWQSMQESEDDDDEDDDDEDDDEEDDDGEDDDYE
jgi:hypothetical protein